jgi:hypothetical protein
MTYCVKALVMNYINQLGMEYEGLISVASGLFGLAGFLFGAWRYSRERIAQNDLKRSKQELDQALSRLKHLESFAAGLKQYSAAV